jgi:hypothetical protein
MSTFARIKTFFLESPNNPYIVYDYRAIIITNPTFLIGRPNFITISGLLCNLKSLNLNFVFSHYRWNRRRLGLHAGGRYLLVHVLQKERQQTQRIRKRLNEETIPKEYLIIG